MSPHLPSHPGKAADDFGRVDGEKKVKELGREVDELTKKIAEQKKQLEVEELKRQIAKEEARISSSKSHTSPSSDDPASLSRSGSPTGLLERRVAVNFKDQTRFLQLPVNSLEAFVASLRNLLGISSPMTVTYYDPGMDIYGTLENILHLPTERAKVKVVTEAMSWWSWTVDPASWITDGVKPTQYSSVLVKEGPHIHHQPAFDKFILIAKHLGFDPKEATKIFAISNETLLKMFEGYRDVVQGMHLGHSAKIFKKDDWTSMEEPDRRKSCTDWHSDLSSKFPWNDDTKPVVIPMLQGTSESAVWQICEKGFGVVGTTDDGYYGAGVYFTSKLWYAEKYAKSGTDGSKPFFVSMVIPGNPFPVVEHPFTEPVVFEEDRLGNKVRKGNPAGFKGKGCRAGYQSHLTLVEGRDIRSAYPIKGAVASDTADELVTFDHAQAIPLFVFYMNTK